MNHFTKISTILFFLSILFNSNISAQSFLHTSNKKIVNDSGNEVLFNGIGLGGWLLMEGYMLHTSGFANAQWEIKKDIENLVGSENAQQFYDLYRANYVNRNDINKIAEWGFNSIRLPFHYNILTPPESPGVYLEEGFAEVHRSNMTKLDEMGRPVYREDGKVIKSHLYEKPNLTTVLHKQ